MLGAELELGIVVGNTVGIIVAIGVEFECDPVGISLGKRVGILVGNTYTGGSKDG